MTREELEQEIIEKTEDLEVFARALDMMRTRIVHSQDHSRSHLPLHQWAGATGLVEIGTVIVHNMERVLEELKAGRAAVKGPALRLVQGERDGEAE
jgi:hypothetical protein